MPLFIFLIVKLIQELHLHQFSAHLDLSCGFGNVSMVTASVKNKTQRGNPRKLNASPSTSPASYTNPGHNYFTKPIPQKNINSLFKNINNEVHPRLNF